MPNLRDTANVLNDAYCLRPISTHTRMTAVASSTTLTAPTGATKLLIQATGSIDIRYTMDGATAPTNASGFVIVHDDPPIAIPVVDGVQISMVQEAASATVDYQWFGLPA
jgi:hypothetical protein